MSDPLDFLPPETIVMDCASCGRTMTKQPERDRSIPFLGGRILGRPYCWDCIQTRRPPPNRHETAEDNPLQQDAIRFLEDGSNEAA